VTSDIPDHAPADTGSQLEATLETIQRFALLDFTSEAPVVGEGDVVDALAAGVNMLGEELRVLRDDMEQRVERRTQELSRANELLQAEAAQRRRTEDALQQSNGQLREWIAELERLHSEMSRLSDMSNLLQACQTRGEAYAALAHASQGLFSDADGCIYIYPPSRDQLAVVTRWGTSPPGEVNLDAGDCWGLRRGRLHHTVAGPGQVRCGHSADTSHATYCMPLMARGDILGLLHLRSSGTDEAESAAAKRRTQLVQAVAEQISLAIANLELRAALEVQSIRDPLTGLFNRRYFEESLTRELKRAERASTQVTVMIADVDRFKQFNDTFGHVAGDLALHEIAARLQDLARAEDVVTRYGGEEIAITMADTPADVALERARGLVDAVRALRVEWRGQLMPRLTISVGVAVYPDHGDTVYALVDKADGALYRAKAQGRDQVAIAEAGEPWPADHPHASSRPSRDTTPEPQLWPSAHAHPGDVDHAHRSPAPVSARWSPLASWWDARRSRRTALCLDHRRKSARSDITPIPDSRWMGAPGLRWALL
jgi:diguanylate cyclase (GGDEF)-like protein